MNKKIIDSINHCYCLNFFKIKNKDLMIFASEENDLCCAYDLNNNLKKEIIWENPGGTMSIIPIKNTNHFLATQKFYPGFNSKNTIITKTSYINNKWETKKIIDFPYLHRFDIIYKNNKYYFIGCTICTSKSSIDDWSDPGKIYVGEYNIEKETIENIKILKDNLLKNHGYIRHNNISYISTESGIFKVLIPDKYNDWKIEKFCDIQASEIAFIDINNDGYDEMLTIEKFHGNKIRIYDNINTSPNLVYEYPNKIDFSHLAIGVQSNKLGNIFLCGARSINKEIFYIYYDNNEYNYKIIENNVGPSNGLFIKYNNEELVFIANREINEVCYYKI